MSELYICVECEVTTGNIDPVEANEHGMCKRCGSSSLVSVRTLTELSNKAKLAEVVRETPTDQTQARFQAMKDQRSKDHEPLRSYLRTLQYETSASDYETSAERVLNEQLEAAIKNWDGWAYHIYYPWAFRFDEELNPIPGKWVIALYQSKKDSTCYYIVIDEYLYEVRSFQKGTE